MTAVDTKLRTLVMAVLNITPDSFADGGRHFSYADALIRGKAMISEGADIIDVGGESTRPGAQRIPIEEELNRVIPIITELSGLGAVISIDTMRSEVATAAISAGATYVNDVSGGLADPKMSGVLANSPHIQFIAMHWRAHSAQMQNFTRYKDVVTDVKNELEARVENLIKAGLIPEQIIIDPGIGFAKESHHNWEILRNIDRFQLIGFPVLVGASRKRFLGEVTGATSPDDREAASIAITTEMARMGVWGVRTHGVRAHRDAITVIQELRGI